VIEIENVSKSYGRRLVVDGVTLRLPAGGVTSIIGPNGAGKSTLLGIVARLLTADGGRVSVDGLDVSTTKSDALARRLAVLRQDNHLNVKLSVRELVAFGRFPHSRGRLTATDLRHVDQAIAYVELGELADRTLDELSGGQRQRAFVAMVLAQDTDYVLLDEPLNNLDLRHSAQMMRLLGSLARDFGKTIVVVMHDINFASAHSDHVVAMKGGAVLGSGTVAEMIEPFVLREVYDLDIEVQVLGGRRVALYFA
jgi:iron complex transport system ATP-binding protein